MISHSSSVCDRTAALIDLLTAQGAEAIIAGCTEYSLVLTELAPDIPVFDPMDALVDAVLRECLGGA